MSKDYKLYRRTLREHMDMFKGNKLSKVVTDDEYMEKKELGIAIEKILEARYGDNIMNQIRMGGLWK